MKKLLDIFIPLKAQFSEKDSRRFQLQQLLNLMNKLHDFNIEDEEIVSKNAQILQTLKLIKDGDLTQRKNYTKSSAHLKKLVENKYDLVAKGTYTNMYLALGLSLGICFGAALSASNSTLMPIGMMFGMTFGIILGSSKEKKLAEQGKLY